jgi:hypothetical protein
VVSSQLAVPIPGSDVPLLLNNTLDSTLILDSRLKPKDSVALMEANHFTFIPSVPLFHVRPQMHLGGWFWGGRAMRQAYYQDT